jgi:hypothetical protein
VNVLEDWKITLANQTTRPHLYSITGTVFLARRRLRDASAPAFKGSAMSEFSVKNYVLMCMRLAAECRGLAADVSEPDLRAQFLRLASTWTELAEMPHVLH